MVAVILILVIVFFVGIGALAFVLAVGSLHSDEKGRKAALASADVDLAELFDGRVTATYESTPRTLPFDVVMTAAARAGYTLAGQTDNPGNRKTLVFSRAQAS